MNQIIVDVLFVAENKGKYFEVKTRILAEIDEYDMRDFSWSVYEFNHFRCSTDRCQRNALRALRKHYTEEELNEIIFEHIKDALDKEREDSLFEWEDDR